MPTLVARIRHPKHSTHQLIRLKRSILYFINLLFYIIAGGIACFCWEIYIFWVVLDPGVDNWGHLGAGIWMLKKSRYLGRLDGFLIYSLPAALSGPYRRSRSLYYARSIHSLFLVHGVIQPFPIGPRIVSRLIGTQLNLVLLIRNLSLLYLEAFDLLEHSFLWCMFQNLLELFVILQEKVVVLMDLLRFLQLRWPGLLSVGLLVPYSNLIVFNPLIMNNKYLPLTFLGRTTLTVSCVFRIVYLIL